MRVKVSPMESQTNIPDYSLPEERVPLFEPEHLGGQAKSALKAEIAELLKARGATLIAHYYVDGDVQDLAEETGGAVADSLEMARFGVKVSAVEPGNFKSDISASAMARMARQEVQRPDTRYAEEWKGFTDRPADRSQYKEPDEVAAAVLHGLFDSNPKARYMVVPNQEEAQRTIGEAIKELVELNEDQPYSYSREQLIEMIDAAMAASD